MSQHTAQDQAAMRSIQAGNEAGLSTLYDRLTPKLLGVATRILGNRADAEDAVQRTWVQVWEQAERYDPTRGTVGAWVVTRLRSRALDILRSRTARRSAESRAQEAQQDSPRTARQDPARALQATSEHERVTRALGTLKPRERQVLETAFFDGLSQSQIAERYEAPLGSVKTWMRRGLISLRNALGREEHP